MYLSVCLQWGRGELERAVPRDHGGGAGAVARHQRQRHGVLPPREHARRLRPLPAQQLGPLLDAAV